MSKKETSVVWFKRDLRLTDHLPLKKAIALGKPVILIYCFDPKLIEDPHYDRRHWRFVWESLEDMSQELQRHGQQLIVFHAGMPDVLPFLKNAWNVTHLFSHEETGLKITYDTDLWVKQYCKEEGILWDESPYNGIQRRLSHRKNWVKNWHAFMYEPVHDVDLSHLKTTSIDPSRLTGHLPIPEAFQMSNAHFQRGGREMALKYMHSFLNGRVKDYSRFISKPLESRRSCSRLSPYLAWGNLSLREVYQARLRAKASVGYKQPSATFAARLQWHDHFVQKFESEERYEFENINKGYNTLDRGLNEMYLEAWEKGETRVPLVDACMRCLKSTGYINFRMRAMLVSFLTHHLWQDWKQGAIHLATHFLDFEPGIHYTQFQMQAGTTGLNTLRIYNPIKQSKEHDPKGLFIKQWVPELAAVPEQYIHEPWLMPPLEAQILGLQVKDLLPIVDVTKAAEQARKKLWAHKKHPEVRSEGQRILKKHVIPRSF